MGPTDLVGFFVSLGQGILRLAPNRFLALSEAKHLPTPDHSYRGVMARQEAAAGVADSGPAYAVERADETMAWDTLALASRTQPLDADLSAIAELVDPGADHILFWDDSARAYAYLTPGAGLSITSTTLNAAAAPTPTVTPRESAVGGVGTGATGQVTAASNAGEVAHGGGCAMSGTSSAQFEGIGSITGCTCRMRNDTGSGQAITAQVYCLAVG